MNAMTKNDRILMYYEEARILFCGDICPSPRMATIYVTYGCNLNCPGCLCSEQNHEKVMMDFNDFKNIANQLKMQGVKSIEFCGGGEPLMHPQIKEMISWVTDRLHLSIGIMTNGVLLSEDLLYLVLSRVKYIRISIYESNEAIVCGLIQKLIEMKRRIGSNTNIGVKFLVNPDNQDRLLEYMKKYIKMDLNLISVKARRGDKLDDVDYSEFINKISEFDKQNKISANLEKTALKGNCWMSPIHTLIDPRGDIYICCYYMHREKSHRIGNILETPFKEIWGSDIHRTKIKEIKNHECNIYDCRWHGYNQRMRELFEENYIQHEFC